MNVGILGLQGAVDLHRERIEALGAKAVIVRRAEHLTNLAGIILPGGESSAMLRLLRGNELFEPLKEFTRTRPTWGLCAGAILLAKHVSNPTQDSLGILDIRVTRNAYGRQLDSFITTLEPTAPSDWDGPVEGVFIRAPRIEVDDPGRVKVLFTLKNQPVMVQQDLCLAASFHPELSERNNLHLYFLNLISQHL